MMGGFRKTASVRPGGGNPNDKTVMINPPGAYIGGVNENFSPVLTSNGGHQSGRYASYWNAFLFDCCFFLLCTGDHLWFYRDWCAISVRLEHHQFIC